MDNVAVFWDYENCPAPANTSGYAIVNSIRSMAQNYGSIKSLRAYVGITEQFSVLRALALRSELQSSGVSLIDCPHNGRKDVADKMMIVDMLAHAIDNPAPSTIILISGDRDFAYALSILRLRRYQVILCAPPHVHGSLLAQASQCIEWTNIILNPADTAPKWNADQPSGPPRTPLFRDNYPFFGSFPNSQTFREADNVQRNEQRDTASYLRNTGQRSSRRSSDSSSNTFIGNSSGNERASQDILTMPEAKQDTSRPECIPGEYTARNSSSSSLSIIQTGNAPNIPTSTVQSLVPATKPVANTPTVVPATKPIANTPTVVPQISGAVPKSITICESFKIMPNASSTTDYTPSAITQEIAIAEEIVIAQEVTTKEVKNVASTNQPEFLSKDEMLSSPLADLNPSIQPSFAPSSLPPPSPPSPPSPPPLTPHSPSPTLIIQHSLPTVSPNLAHTLLFVPAPVLATRTIPIVPVSVSHANQPLKDQQLPTARAPIFPASIPVSVKSSMSRKVVPSQFRVLVRVLQVYRSKAVLAPTRKHVSRQIRQVENGDGSTYKKAGVVKFSQYISLAEKEGIIQQGGKEGDAWISLKPEWYGAIVT